MLQLQGEQSVKVTFIAYHTIILYLESSGRALIDSGVGGWMGTCPLPAGAASGVAAFV